MNGIVKIEPEGLRPEAAAEFIGVSRRVLSDADAAGWVQPCVRRKRCIIYRPSALRLLLNRIEREGLPPKATRKSCAAAEKDLQNAEVSGQPPYATPSATKKL